jgi:predicted RNA-binding Zn ribbon-like protein
LRKRGLLERGVVLTAADRQRALDARAGIRALLFANSGCPFDPTDVERLNLVLRGRGVLPQLGAHQQPTFTASRRDLDGALAVIASIVAAAQLQRRFERLKACPGPDCGWAFYDHSRNQASAWCSMSICGARVKARSYRTRQRLSGPDR